MTDENRLANAAQARTFAERFLLAARALAQMGIWDQALGRLYYALFHAVRAVLLTEGLQPRRHSAAHALLSLHFVKPGRLDKKHSDTLRDLQQERESADYTPLASIDEAQFHHGEERVLEALRALDKILRDRGVPLS